MQSTERPDTCVVILAGGKSRRMGSNKALLQIGGRSLIETIIHVAKPLGRQVFISANEQGPYQFLKLPVLADVFPGKGPLAGIHAVMLNTTFDLYLVLACDLPNLKPELLKLVMDQCDDYDAVVPRSSDGRLHPLCAIYRRTCLTIIERNLILGMNKVSDFLKDPSLRFRYVDSDGSAFRDSDLLNLNEMSDLG